MYAHERSLERARMAAAVSAKTASKKKAAASVSPPFCVGATPPPRVNVHYRGKVY